MAFGTSNQCSHGAFATRRAHRLAQEVSMPVIVIDRDGLKSDDELYSLYLDAIEGLENPPTFEEWLETH